MFRLALCADTIFCDLPFTQRVKQIAKAGFLVDFWRWMDRDIDAIAADPSVTITGITGYVGGSLVHPDGLEEYMKGVEQTLAVAKKLRCKQLVLSTGEINHEGKPVHQVARHPATFWITAYKGLCRAAELAEKHDVVYGVEHLNTKVDHGGYTLPLVEDAVRLIEEVGSPRIRLLLDVYHAQIEEGNVTQIIRDYSKYLSYVHVADVPGRHEPGTGEINYPHIARVLKETGYSGIVALEAYPESDPHKAMSRFREVFG
ncbi:MAG TPA: TIM barrel protein [Planctomycetaceae bacterium]|nr:TIM barrel protein [Planctomycetaceae bacterium]